MTEITNSRGEPGEHRHESIHPKPQNFKVDVSEIDTSLWSGKNGWPMAAAMLIAKYAPRGKGSLPRLIGRAFGSQIHSWIRTPSSAKLAVEPDSLDLFAFLAANEHGWDDEVLNTCASYLGKGDTFYDIGANIGYYSIEMAKRFDDEISVVAVEPQPKLSRSIALSARLNGFRSITTLQLMIGEEDGSRDLFLHNHSIHASAVPRKGAAIPIHCPLATIDNLLSSGQIAAPRVIKVDVEGGELEVFRGARHTLQKYRPVLVFECDQNSQRFGYGRADILNYLRSVARYEFYEIKNDGGLVPIDPIDPVQPVHSDILAKTPDVEDTAVPPLQPQTR